MHNKLRFLIIFMAGIWGCHAPSAPLQPANDPRQEFRAMKWMEGLWKEATDSITAYHQWHFTDDTDLEETGWMVKTRDSVWLEKMNIHADEEEGIVLEYEKQGLNEGIPYGYRLVKNRNGEHVFENQSHKFPERIIILLRPDGAMYVRTEGNISGENHYNELMMNKIK